MRGWVCSLQWNHQMVLVALDQHPIFTILSETPPTWRAKSLYLYPPGQWVPFLLPLTTHRLWWRQSTWSTSTRGWSIEVKPLLWPTVSWSVCPCVRSPSGTCNQYSNIELVYIMLKIVVFDCQKKPHRQTQQDAKIKTTRWPWSTGIFNALEMSEHGPLPTDTCIKCLFTRVCSYEIGQ
jgi:hypothetical protein